MAKANAGDASLQRTVEKPHAFPHTHKGCYVISGVVAISPNSTALTVFRPLPVLNSKGISRSFVTCLTGQRWGGAEGGDSQTTLPAQQVSNPLNLALSSLL